MKKTDPAPIRLLRVCEVLCLSLILLLSSAAVKVSAEDFAGGWYFRKTEDHTQPPPDAPLAYTETLGAYSCDRRASDDDRVIYLTFDAGYENGNVEKILDTLKKHNAGGAFFVLSHFAASRPDLIRRMAAEGSLICNHTAHHKDMTKLDETAFREELTALEAAVKEKTGCEVSHYYRPPEGKFDRKTLTWAKDMGYKTIFWSYAYCDWDNDRQPDPEQAKKQLLLHTHNGMVLLLHPTSATNASILDDLMTAWEKEGYRFGSLDELTREAAE